MIRLNLPSFEIKIVNRNGQLSVFDSLRHRYIHLTPEEWVRQHFIHFLTEQKGYPAHLLANEVSIELNGVRRRCDSVLYTQQLGQPKMIIEYKAPHIPITQEVFNQICSYNSVLRVEYLTVSNGMQHFCFHLDYERQTYTPLAEIPDYGAL